MTPLLQRLDGLDSRFAEVGTLITDPEVIADQKRYVKLTKEYHDLEKIVEATKQYRSVLATIEDAKDVIENESDQELRELAREELDEASSSLPEIEERIKLLLIK